MMIKNSRKHQHEVLLGPIATSLIFMLLPVSANAAEDSGTPLDVVATVNGEPVYSQSLERSLSRTHQSMAGSNEASFDLDRLMFRAVNDVLIGQEARAMGLDEEPEIIAQVDEYRTELAMKKLDSVEIRPRVQVSEEEIQALFDEQYARVTFHVITAYERDEADELLAALRQGADFESLVEEKSVDPYRLRKGLVDKIARFDLRRDMAELVFSHKPGELAGPIQTDLGWSVVAVDSFEKADADRLEAVRSTVGSLVAQNKALAARRALAADLRRKHKVVVDDSIVEAIQPEPGPDGRHLPSEHDPADIVATIGNTQLITAGEYSKQLAGRWKRVRNIDAARASAPIVLNNLIEAKLMLVEAEVRGYSSLPIVEKSTHAFETEILIPRYLEEVVASNVKVTLEEQMVYYEKHKQEFHRPPSVRLAQVTVETRLEAEKIADSLRQGADVAWLARENSTDRLAESGGDRGWYVPQPDVAGFNQDLFDAQIGTVLDPFGSAENWIVLKVTDRKEQGIYKFEEISGNIREAVFGENFKEALDQFIKTLRSRSEIEVHQEALQALSITGTQTEETSEEHGGGHAH